MYIIYIFANPKIQYNLEKKCSRTKIKNKELNKKE